MQGKRFIPECRLTDVAPREALGDLPNSITNGTVPGVVLYVLVSCDKKTGAVVQRVGFGRPVDHIPDSSRFVTRTGGDESAVGGKVETVDIQFEIVKYGMDAFLRYGCVSSVQMRFLAISQIRKSRKKKSRG